MRGRSIRTLEDLVDLLESSYPPKCIGEKEDPISAHRYAAKVELVGKIGRMVRRGHAVWSDVQEVEI